MDVHASEKEKVEALGKWWKDNGSSIITGVLLGLSLLLGGKAWLSYQENQKLAASNVYAQMMAAVGRAEQESVQTHANTLISEYPTSVYATLAAMALARQAVENDEFAAAHAQLEWALDNAKTPEIEHAARARLVRVMIEQAQYAQALRLLESVPEPGSYQFIYSELRGDIAAAQGEPEEAAKAYRTALAEAPAQVPNLSLLSAKLESVSAGSEVE